MDYTETARQIILTLQSMCGHRKQRGILGAAHGETHILFYLHMRGQAVLPGEISRRMRVSTARVAAALNSLETKGFIRRDIDPGNRRQVLVTLTTEGRLAAERRQNELIGEMSAILAGLGERDAKELLRILQRLKELADAAQDAETAGDRKDYIDGKTSEKNGKQRRKPQC